MKLSEIRSLARSILSDVPAAAQNPTTFSDADVVLAINQAIADYCVKTRATVTEVSNSFATTGLSTAITDSLAFLEVVGLDQTEVEFENRKSSTWRTATPGTPRRWLPWTGTVLRCIPAPTGATSLTIRYIQKPVDLITVTDDNNSPDARIPVTHHDALAYGAVAMLLLFDTDAQDYSVSHEMMSMFDYKIGVGPEPARARAAMEAARA